MELNNLKMQEKYNLLYILLLKGLFMEKKSKYHLKNIILLYFLMVCTIILIYIFIPLLIRIPIIYRGISLFLGIFNDTEYKSIYIGTLGTILGTFLAITGTLLTQKIMTEYGKKIESKKYATIIYYDLKFATDNIYNILNCFSVRTNRETLSNNQEDIIIFRNIKREYPISINSEWLSLVANLQEELEPIEVKRIHDLYTKLTIISNSFYLNDNSVSIKEEQNIYSLMWSLYNKPKENDKCIKSQLKVDYINILAKINKITNM